MIKLLRENTDDGVFTNAEKKALVARRDALNAKLMLIATGESCVVPIYDFVPLPGTKWQGPADSAEHNLRDAIAACRSGFYGKLVSRHRELAAIGVQASDEDVLESLMPDWTRGASEMFAVCQQVVNEHGDLWTLSEFHRLAGLALLLSENGLMLPACKGEADADG